MLDQIRGGDNGKRVHGSSSIRDPSAGIRCADPETAVTGLSRAEHQQLDQIIRADIAEAFRSGGDIPLLPSDRSRATEVRPLLAIHIGWARVVDRVEFDMGSSYNSVASAPDLAAVVRSVTRGQVDSFVSLYVRAHAKPA